MLYTDDIYYNAISVNWVVIVFFFKLTFAYSSRTLDLLQNLSLRIHWASSAVADHVHNPLQHHQYLSSPPIQQRNWGKWNQTLTGIPILLIKACFQQIVMEWLYLFTFCLIQTSTCSTFCRNSRKSRLSSRTFPRTATACFRASQWEISAEMVCRISFDFGCRMATSSFPALWQVHNKLC